MELELAGGEALPEVRLDGAALAQLGVHVGLEPAAAAGALALGPAQRDVGVLQQLIRAAAIARDQDHADAGGHGQAVALDLEGLGQAPLQMLAERLGILRLADARLQDRELVAAGPGDHAGRMQAGPQALGAGLDQLIADPRAQGIVDLAEPIQIEAQEGRRFAVPGARHGLREPFAKLAPMRQAGHRVVGGKMPGLGLGDHGARHVGATAAEADHPSGAVVDRPAADLQMPFAAIGVGNPELEILEGAAANQIAAVAHPGVVVGQRPARPPECPLARQLDERRRRIVRHLGQLLLGVDLPGPLQRPARSAVRRGGGGLRRGGVHELDQLALGLLPAGDLDTQFLRAPHGEHAGSDRERDQERPELAEQPAPAMARQFGEQRPDVDEHAERQRPGQQNEHPQDVAPAGAAAEEPERAGSEIGSLLRRLDHDRPPKAGASPTYPRRALTKPVCRRAPGRGRGGTLALPRGVGYS